jgi:transcriptional regulator with XRE-family HTH domain
MPVRKTTNPELGPFFKKLRIQAKITIEAMAAHLQISVEDVESYESGVEPIPFNHIHALASSLNASEAEVLRLISYK